LHLFPPRGLLLFFVGRGLTDARKVGSLEFEAWRLSVLTKRRVEFFDFDEIFAALG
jgi:hypothetical protein